MPGWMALPMPPFPPRAVWLRFSNSRDVNKNVLRIPMRTARYARAALPHGTTQQSVTFRLNFLPARFYYPATRGCLLARYLRCASPPPSCPTTSTRYAGTPSYFAVSARFGRPGRTTRSPPCHTTATAPAVWLRRTRFVAYCLCIADIRLRGRLAGAFAVSWRFILQARQTTRHHRYTYGFYVTQQTCRCR